MDCFGTYLTHVQTCDNVRVQSATQGTASVHTWHMSKPVITFVFKVLRKGLLRYILDTCPNCSKRYAMDCFGTYLTHVQARDNVRVQSATQWSASVHTWHMSKPVITFVFKVRCGKIHSWCNPLYPLNNQGFFIEKQSQNGGFWRLYVRRRWTTMRNGKWFEFWKPEFCLQKMWELCWMQDWWCLPNQRQYLKWAWQVGSYQFLISL